MLRVWDIIVRTSSSTFLVCSERFRIWIMWKPPPTSGRRIWILEDKIMPLRGKAAGNTTVPENRDQKTPVELVQRPSKGQTFMLIVITYH